jgi:GT2 family glycosyltransferase
MTQNTHAVVVTYKAPDLLERCLASLRPQCNFKVIDNSPPAENLLYTEAINSGILDVMSSYDYILVCCDDVIVRPGAVAALEAYLDSNPDCAIAMPIQVAKDGSTTCGGCMAAFPYGRHITEPLGHSLYEKPFESFWANGACFLLRTEAVRECGLMDENMKFICSDSDYSFTLRARGWKIFVVPSAIVQHEPNGALKTDNTFLAKIKDQDALYFIGKWLSGGLYQSLSHEGPTLKAKEITDQIHNLSWRLAEAYKE